MKLRRYLNLTSRQREDREHTTTSLTTQRNRDQAGCELDDMRPKSIAAARQGRADQRLRQKSSVAYQWDEKTELQKRFDAQSIELNHLHNELGQIKISLTKLGADVSDSDLAHHVAGALEKKEKEIEELRRDLATAASRTSDLQKSHEVLSRLKVSALNDELAVKASQYKGTVQADQSRATDADKTQQLTIALNRIQELQLEVSTATAQFTKLQDSYATQSKELASVSNQLQTVTLSDQEKDKIISSVTAERDQQMSANATKAEQIAKLQRELSVYISQLTDLQDRYKALSHELASVSRKFQIDISSNGDKDHQVAVLMDEIRRHHEESRALKSALAENQSQLRTVQRIVATADTYADEMIISVLKKLNAELQQNTTYMAEGIAEDFQPRTTKPTKEQFSATRSVSKSIGESMANCLASMKCDDVALYLSIAFQAYFSYYLHQIISSWTIEKGHNDFINQIYEQLQKAEAQPMSGRWRSLTRAYISPTWMSNPGSLTQQIVADLSDVVVAAGCAASATAANSKLSSFRDKVLSIISIAGQFSEMIGKVVSADFAVTAPPPLQVFEETTMEEDVDDYDYHPGMVNTTAAGQKVLCSTQLGMTKRMQRESGKEMLTVIKAKILLESYLDG